NRPGVGRGDRDLREPRLVPLDQAPQERRAAMAEGRARSRGLHGGEKSAVQRQRPEHVDAWMDAGQESALLAAHDGARREAACGEVVNVEHAVLVSGERRHSRVRCGVWVAVSGSETTHPGTVARAPVTEQDAIASL